MGLEMRNLTFFKVNPSYFSTKVDILNSPTVAPSEDKWLEDLSCGPWYRGGGGNGE